MKIPIALSICIMFFASIGQASAPTDVAQDLARALELNYHGKYEEALTIFNKISDRHENRDLLYWTGSNAVKSGDYDLAIQKLEKALEREPKLNRARLELAVAYHHAGRKADARREFEMVKAASPPGDVARIADQYLAGIDKPADPLTWTVRAAIGYQYDSNITCGPSDAEIGDTVRTETVILKEDSKEKSASNALADMKADLTYDIGGTGGFMWNGGLDAFYSHSFEDTDYNYLEADLFTGPWWVLENDVAKLPAGFLHKQYGGEALSNTFYAAPSYERFFGKSFSVKAAYSLASERYDDAKYSDAGYDNIEHCFSAGPNFYPKNRRQIISGFLTYDMHDADASDQSYTGIGLTAMYFARFRTKTEILLHYKYTDRTYDGSSELYDKDREDTRNKVNAVVGQHFADHWFASAELAYINNSSNSELYDYEKTAFTLSVGAKF